MLKIWSLLAMPFVVNKFRCFIPLGVAALLLFASCSPKPESPDTFASQIQTVDQFLQQGDTRQAIKVLDQLLQLYPENPEIIERLARAQTDAGNLFEAAIYFEQMAQLNPDAPEYLLSAARNYELTGSLSTAARCYEQYLETDSRNAVIWKSLGAIEQQRSRESEALRAYLQSFELRPDPKIGLEIGKLFLNQENTLQASRYFEAATESTGTSKTEALAGLLQISLADNNLEAAAAQAKQLRASMASQTTVPTSVLSQLQAYDDVADRLQEEERKRQEAIAKAEAERKRLAAQQAENEAEANRKAKELAEATETAATASETPANEDWVVTTEVAAVTSEVPQGFVTEITLPDEVRLPDTEIPEQPKGKITIASSGNGVNGEAGVRVISSPMEDSAPSAATLLERAYRLRDQGDLEQSILAFRQALLLDDSQAGIWFDLSNVLYDDGQFRWAEATALEARRRDPTRASYMLQFLRATQKNRTPQLFFAELLQAREQFPSSPEIALALARGYARINGNKRNAELLYREFLARAPNHPQRAIVENELAELGL